MTIENPETEVENAVAEEVVETEEETVAEQDSEPSEQEEDADTSAEPEGSDGEDSPAKPKKGVQKRIDELTAARRTAERERDYWMSLAQKKQEVSDEPEMPTPPDPSLALDKPDEYRAQSDKWRKEMAEYNKKLLDWRDSQKAAESQEKEVESVNTELDQQWARKVEAFKEEAGDFDKLVAREDNPVSQHMFEIAKRSDLGPQVLYELAKNPEHAMRIYHMNPIQTAHEMGKIEARLAVKPKKQTSAPDPVSTVSGGGEKGVQNPDDLPIEEWMARERRRRAEKYG